MWAQGGWPAIMQKGPMAVVFWPYRPSTRGLDFDYSKTYFWVIKQRLMGPVVVLVIP
jgi:hypothetical protein